MAYTQDHLYFSISTPLGKDKLLLRGFSGSEGLSELFSFDLEMESESPSLDFAQVVGKSCTITVQLADGSQRYLNGIVRRFVQEGSAGGFARYRAVLVPALWLLTRSANCRIFQEKSTPEILEAILGEFSITFKKSLKASYTTREYCVQYNETAFDFLSRLMEDEGIFYFFEHADGQHTLVLADDPSAFTGLAGAATIDYGDTVQWHQQNTIVRCELEQNVLVGKAAGDDFNFETPSTDLIAEFESTLAQDGSLRRVYEYPGLFLKKDAGDARTKLRIEEFEVPDKLLSGDSFCRPMSAGYKFTLARHYRADVNTDWALRRVAHRARWDGYSNSFEAIPATATFRPPRTQPWPRIAGLQTAIVVGKSGEEIWTDSYGRIKVQFHWDQEGQNDEKSSCWIRVAHGWAGKSWGQIFIPRIGQEVVISFLDGNPDRPLVTGSVYNAEQTVPYPLPGDQTKSTIKSNVSKGGGGYNELRFEDKKDSEEVYLQAEKDMNRVVKNSDTLKVGFEKKNPGSQTIDIYQDRTVTLDQGNEKLQVKKGNRTVLVDTGTEQHDVKGTRTLTITGAEQHNNKDNFVHQVDKDYTLTIAGNLTIDVTGTVAIKAGKTLDITSGQAMTLDSGAGLTAKAAQALTNQAGTSLTNKAGTELTNQAGTDLNNKASLNLNNEGTMVSNKASATQTVDGGGMLTIKGGLVKIN